MLRYCASFSSSRRLANTRSDASTTTISSVLILSSWRSGVTTTSQYEITPSRCISTASVRMIFPSKASFKSRLKALTVGGKQVKQRRLALQIAERRIALQRRAPRRVDAQQLHVAVDHRHANRHLVEQSVEQFSPQFADFTPLARARGEQIVEDGATLLVRFTCAHRVRAVSPSQRSLPGSRGLPRNHYPIHQIIHQRPYRRLHLCARRSF